MPEATRPDFINCARCGKEKKVGRSGPIPTYCSGACRAALKYERSRENGSYAAALAAGRQRTIERRAKQAKPCPYCDTPMEHPRRVQCGAESCKRRYTADKQMARSRAIKEATGQWPHRKYAVQQREYDKRRRAEQGHWRLRYPEAAALSDARRRMLIDQAVKGEPFAPKNVHERDQWTCGLCRQPVDPGLAWPHPMSASVDRIVPLSQGGDHTLANVQCAHLSCNSRKCNQTIEEIGEAEAVIAAMGDAG